MTVKISDSRYVKAALAGMAKRAGTAFKKALDQELDPLRGYRVQTIRFGRVMFRAIVRAVVVPDRSVPHLRRIRGFPPVIEGFWELHITLINVDQDVTAAVAVKAAVAGRKTVALSFHYDGKVRTGKAYVEQVDERFRRGAPFGLSVKMRGVDRLRVSRRPLSTMLVASEELFS